MSHRSKLFTGRGRGRGRGFPNVRNFESRNRLRDDSEPSDRPPPGLRGRDLGLWYRDRNRSKQKTDKKERDRQKNLVHLDLPSWAETEVLYILKGLGRSPSFNTGINSRDSGSISTKYSHVEDSSFKRKFLTTITEALEDKMQRRIGKQEPADEDMSRILYEEYLSQIETPRYKEMLKQRMKLPSYEMRNEILDVISNNQVIVISGETGCGKTTQVPQFILERHLEMGIGSECCIVCTQPRRISAVSVAERIADERAEKIGHSIGYRIRLESVQPRKWGYIQFVTTGVLLEFMESNPTLNNISHVIIDEVHERDTLCDFTLCLLRDVIKLRKDLKVILMSATLNAEKFSQYFGKSPHLNIPGFTFPVKEYYLEDVLMMTRFDFHNFNESNRRRKRYSPGMEKTIAEFEQNIAPFIRNAYEGNSKFPQSLVNTLLNYQSEELNLDLVLELLKHIDRNEPPGAVLVFLPGWKEISTLETMMKRGPFTQSRHLILPLHSMLPTVTQKAIFDRPPSGVRKFILSTNIAETSITIEDIVYVVDCGRIKMKNYIVDLNLSTLNNEWVSLANAHQRRGRAGRVQNGVVYHLFTKARKMFLESYHLPEILRIRLEEVILQAKILQIRNVGEFLSKLLDPPSSEAITVSIKLLHDMNALDSDERLTPLGYHLASLPIDPQSGKMLIFASLFGCVSFASYLGACLSFKSPFFIPMAQEDLAIKRRLELDGSSKSDHILQATALKKWKRESNKKDFSSYYFLSSTTCRLLVDMSEQFGQKLYDMKLIQSPRIDHPDNNFNGDDIAVMKAVVASGLMPNIAFIRKINKYSLNVGTPEDGRVYIHKGSINAYEREFHTRLLVYKQKLRSKDIYLHDTGTINYFPAILFAHQFQLEDTTSGMCKITISNEIEFLCRKGLATLLVTLRELLDSMLVYKVSHPGPMCWNSSDRCTIIARAFVRLIQIEEEMISQTQMPSVSCSINGVKQEVPSDSEIPSFSFSINGVKQEVPSDSDD